MNTVAKLSEMVDNAFKQTQLIIDGMSSEGDGKRMDVKTMAEKVGIACNMEPKYAQQLVSLYVHHSDEVYVARGKKGGVIKGTRPLKNAAETATEEV